MQSTIPDYFLIGYKKAATTFLRSFFENHTDIDWSRNAFYLQENDFDRNAYLETLPQKQKSCKVFIDCFEGLCLGVVGNKDDWAQRGFTPGLSLQDSKVTIDHRLIYQRMKDINPNCKVIVVLRNQIDWIRSYYLHHIDSMASDQRNLKCFLDTYEGKLMIHAGLYDKLIQQLHCDFGEKNTIILFFEDLKTFYKETIFELSNKLNIDSSQTPEYLEKNTGKGSSSGVAYEICSKLHINPLHLAKITSYFGLDKTILKLMNFDVMRQKDIAYLKSFYASSNYRLSKIVQKDLRNMGYYY